MEDSYDGYRRRRRRDRVGYGKHGDDVSPTPSKPPVTILGLAKPSRITAPVDDHSVTTGPETDMAENIINQIGELSIDTTQSTDKASVVLLSSDSKTRLIPVKSNELESIESRTQLDESSHSIDEGSSGLIRKVSTAGAVGNMISGVIDQGAQTQLKLAPPPERQATTKIIDGNFQWTDAGHDLMLDQTDFLVVGVVGLQGCGKSTLLSLLTGNTNQDAYRNYVFFPQTKEAKEEGLYQTSGIDMFITSERVIFLDTQPLLSAAMMDAMLNYERKIPSEYSSLNFVETQSMQLLTFMLSVCNIVLVADDWFVDISFLRFIQDAEMLKPSTQASSSADGSASRDEILDFYPTVIFVHNKASRDDFTPETFFSMQNVLHKMFSSSKLKIRNRISMNSDFTSEAIIQRLPAYEQSEAAEVNLLLVPTMEFYKAEPELLETTLPDYRGYPSFNTILSFIRAQILSAPRSPITPTVLTEKTWYHFAARMWESVKKSGLLAEYNRLLSSTT